MKYFKNTELAKIYNISEKSVRNWIDAAQLGKLPLQLHENKGHFYVANISRNTRLIEDLVQRGKKYKNTRGYKTVNPVEKFYNLYNRKQILDIISNLEIHREIPRQYNYFDGGADYWDEFAQHMWIEDSPNLLRSTVELLEANANAIDQLLDGQTKINVIDIGVGNALPVKDLLTRLLKKDKLNRYIGIDISSAMLKIAESNINKWFGGQVKFEGHIHDITYERFDEVLVDDMLQQNSSNRTINLVLLLGGTLTNFRSMYDVLKVIYGSMGHDDLLIYTDKPDSESERRDFDVNMDLQESTLLSPKYKFILDLLNIDESLYDVEMGFNPQLMEKYIHIRLKVAVTIKFEFEGGARTVELKKGDAVLMWRAWYMTALEIITLFHKVGLGLLQSSMTKDRQYLLTISGVDSEAKSSTIEP